MHSKLLDARVNRTFARKAQAVLDDVTGHGYDIRPTTVFREQSEQRMLFAKGRSDKTLQNKGYTISEIKQYRAAKYLATDAQVTKVLSSMHTKGLAMDVAFYGHDGKVIWNTTYEGWEIYGKACKAHGLIWGGTWKTFKDYPHSELSKKDL